MTEWSLISDNIAFFTNNYYNNPILF